MKITSYIQLLYSLSVKFHPVGPIWNLRLFRCQQNLRVDDISTVILLMIQKSGWPAKIDRFYPIICSISYILGGARFQPSTGLGGETSCCLYSSRWRDVCVEDGEDGLTLPIFKEKREKWIKIFKHRNPVKNSPVSIGSPAQVTQNIIRNPVKNPTPIEVRKSPQKVDHFFFRFQMSNLPCESLGERFLGSPKKVNVHNRKKLMFLMKRFWDFYPVIWRIVGVLKRSEI